LTSRITCDFVVSTRFNPPKHATNFNYLQNPPLIKQTFQQQAS